MVLVCRNCGSSETDTDATRGDVVCMNCGAVLEKQLIANEVQFEDNAVGGSSLIGQFVTADGRIAGAASGIGAGLHFGTARESTEQTIAKARKRIQLLSTQLGGLHRRQVEQAVEFFKLALKKEFTKGRPVMHMAAACLYLVCRVEGTSHMLLDLCDQIEADIFVLGQVYLQLTKVLQVQTKVMEPALYVHRFAMRLELGERAHEVEMVALRLVQRMTRDWLATGRRPAGLCAAALLVAARLCGFNRSAEDLARVARICRATLKRRLVEFEQTDSSRLSVQEFKQVDLEHTHDPPAFTAGFDKSKQTQPKTETKTTQVKKGNIPNIVALNDAGFDDAVSEVKTLKERIEKEMERLSRLSENVAPRARELLGMGVEQLGLADLSITEGATDESTGAHLQSIGNPDANVHSAADVSLDSSNPVVEANLMSFLLGETHREILNNDELECIEEYVLPHTEEDDAVTTECKSSVSVDEPSRQTDNLFQLHVASTHASAPLYDPNAQNAEDDDIGDEMNLPAAEIILRFAREQKAAQMAAESVVGEDDARSTTSSFVADNERSSQLRTAARESVSVSQSQAVADPTICKVEESHFKTFLLAEDSDYDYKDIDRDIDDCGYIISDTAELDVRSNEWHAANAVYLREQAEKERQRELERVARRMHDYPGALDGDTDDPKVDADALSVTSAAARRFDASAMQRRPELPRKKRRKRVDIVMDVAEKMLKTGDQSTQSQAQPRMATRKKAASNKINYDVLKQLNADDNMPH